MGDVDSTSEGDRLYELLLVVENLGEGEWCAALYDRSEGALSLPVCEGSGRGRAAAVRDLLRTVTR